MNLQPASNTATEHPPSHCLLMNKVRKVPRPTSADHLVYDPPLPLDPKQPLTRSKLYIHFPIISFLSPGLHLQPQNKLRMREALRKPKHPPPPAPHLNPYLCIQPQNASIGSHKLGLNPLQLCWRSPGCQGSLGTRWHPKFSLPWKTVP